jgi:prephenate dehydrogenase
LTPRLVAANASGRGVFSMKRVAILGPGLLGGSIALALRAAGGHSVSIWARREDAAREALEGGFADRASSDLADMVRDAALIVFCTPIDVMPELAREIQPHVSPGTLITDVGSVKTPVVKELGAIFRGVAQFVGSHPMAGSERTGMAAARADLFHRSVCIVTPEPETGRDTVTAVSDFWMGLGCRVIEASAPLHDARVAWVSHFPHLLAAALVDLVAQEEPGAFAFCGPGFRDTTRVASGAPGMWADILCLNRDALKKTTEAMIEKLHGIKTLLDSEFPEKSMRELLNQAKAERDRLHLPR